MKGDFVTYVRVSTDRQGKSGLGLDAQREAVRTYLNGGNWRIVAEFQEVESGRNDARPALDAALAAARLHRVPLVVAKVDRLTRSVAFLSKLLASGVDVRFADLPQIEGPAGKFMLNQMVAVAELEAGMISARTKAALAAAKARGTKLGGFRGHVATDAAREAGRAAGTARAAARSADLAPVVTELREAGIVSASGIAKALNDREIETPRGGRWQAVQVQRMLARMPA
ncbi:recombinase family protein [Methylobacterium sp. E-016]|uniref:recombinase family protein n=1 Tax=Methylobacterium sp. E-016 TaxID=2836556 RepID=UPI001FBA1FC3|nr:recombinase family protein [Methylobacterium sp. E-016]MCJ2077906.1 recombinase family protein [Methylobacterium sp. E-016]